MAEKIRDALIFSIATIGWCWSVLRGELIYFSIAVFNTERQRGKIECQQCVRFMWCSVNVLMLTN
ncbi:hypothetical protein VCSRO93_2669 [Vibrio cholerae]|nr:hypothetical protein VCSRO93_2669 [Vibrio cholerae]